MRHDNYNDDFRVRASEAAEDWDGLDESRMVAIFVLEDDDGEEENIEVPVKYSVCPTCNGCGSHVNPSIDCNGLTREDFDEDPDFAHDYMTGRYDVECFGCGGKRVVPEIDEERASKPIMDRINEHLNENAKYRSERAYERRMGY